MYSVAVPGAQRWPTSWPGAVTMCSCGRARRRWRRVSTRSTATLFSSPTSSSIRASGRYLDSSNAVVPDSVKATIVSRPMSVATSTAARAVAEAKPAPVSK